MKRFNIVVTFSDIISFFTHQDAIEINGINCDLSLCFLHVEIYYFKKKIGKKTKLCD